jgi:hypothetical protein
LNEVLVCPLNLIRFPSNCAFSRPASVMPTTSTVNGASPKQRKRSRTHKVTDSIPLTLPGSATAVPVGVTPEAALMNLSALQSIPEGTAVQPTNAAPPSGLSSEVTQGVTPDQAGAFLDEVSELDVDMMSAVDDKLKRAELMLAESKRVLDSRSLALTNADGLLAKRLRIKEIQREVAISQAKIQQVEFEAAEFMVIAKAKDAEAARDQLDAMTAVDSLRGAQNKTRLEAESAKAQKEVQNKSQRLGADAVGCSAKPGDQKSPFSVTNSIISSAMFTSLSTPLDLGVDLEDKTLEGSDLLVPFKVKELPDCVIPGVKPVVETSTGQIPPPVVKVVTTPSSTSGPDSVLPAIAAKVDLDKILPGVCGWG